MSTGLENVLIVTAALAVLASYVYLPAFVMTVGMLLDKWAVRRVMSIDVDVALVNSLVPAAELPEPPVLEEPDEHEESRPVDLDDCPRCEGRGEVVTIEDGLPGYRWCRMCRGTGQRGAA